MGIGKILKGGLTGGLVGAAKEAGISGEDILGAMSPAYGAITGRGLMGKALAGMEDIGIGGGVMTKMAQAARDKRRREMQGAGGAANATSISERANVQKKAKGGSIKKMAKGGSTASKRADGCATKGKTKGRFV